MYRPSRLDGPPPLDIPGAYAEASGSEETTAPGIDRWWQMFGDDHLNSLVQKALSDNFDLRQAWSRLDAANALAEVAGASLWPQINLAAGASKSHTVVTAGGRRTSVRSDSRTATPAASYEIDLWGRLRSQRSAAELDAQASRSDLDAAAITLSASVTDVYFSLLEQRERRALILQQSKANETFLELTRLRFSQGQASALDVYQQQQQTAATTAELPLVESRLKVSQHQLAVLLGRTPGTDLTGARADMPALPPLPATGLPASLLTLRPDVRAAHIRVAAADQRLAAAIADRFPAVALSASLPFQATHTADLFRDFVWSIGANLSVPVVDGGRRRAEVDRNRAVKQERLDAYAATLLNALREVEDALVQERQQVAFLARVDEQVDLAQSTLREARSRYANGLSDYLNVLTALRSLQVLELRQIQERKHLLDYRVALCRALGGTWTNELTPPDREAGDTR